MVDPVLEIFQEEALERFRALEGGLLALEEAADDDARRASIDELFRHAHTLRGDARAVGVAELQPSTRALEDLLEELRESPAQATSESISRALAQLDVARKAFERWRADVMGVASAKEVESTTETLPAAVVPAGDESFTVKASSQALDEILNLVGELGIHQRSRTTLMQDVQELRRLIQASLRSLPEDQRGMLGAAIDQVQRIATDLRRRQSRETLLTQSLEREVRRIRLMPLQLLADALRRPVRDLAQALHKEVRYEVDVGAVLLDKAVIETLRTPLLHLIRNALDHGIEVPSARVAAGKPAEGVIRLEARQLGDVVQLNLSDDGAGIDAERIRRQLLASGELNAAAVQAMSEGELYESLFRPGFTTAAPGEISGRGVGLDAVRDTLQRLHGRVELQPGEHAGTTFVLTVPVTISTVRVLTVWHAGQFYGIPSASIVRVGRANGQELRVVQGSNVIPHEGEPIPTVWLDGFLGVEASRPAMNGTAPYVVVKRAGHPLAIFVDRLDEEREVLLKPLGFPLGGLSGFLGGSIRPDGSVQIIIDVESEQFAPFPAVRPATAAPKKRGRILVVDDSPTTRNILRNLFTASGYAVRTAVDGLDALEKLQSHAVDLVVTDFEMPRLSGPDLTRKVKSLYQLPVILVTGREHEHHRREGLEAGADAYIVKSTFQGDNLLDVVRQFV